MEPLCLSVGMTEALMGVVITGIMWVGRSLSTRFNQQTGLVKAGVSFVLLPQIFSLILDATAVDVKSLADLTDPGIAAKLAAALVPLSAGAISVAAWQLIKEVLKWKGKYNLSPMAVKGGP